MVGHELRHDVDGDGEDDGAVLLRRDVVEGLQVAQLKRLVGGRFSSATVGGGRRRRKLGGRGLHFRLVVPRDELRDDVDGDGEDDGAVLLRRDAIQRLKVAQLRSSVAVQVGRQEAERMKESYEWKRNRKQPGVIMRLYKARKSTMKENLPAMQLDFER